jgi:site-specific recombinase XerD
MFERLYKRPRALARHCRSPLAEERRRFLTHCAEAGMSETTLGILAPYLLTITAYLRLADRPPDDLVTPAEIEAQAERWAKRPLKFPGSKQERGGRRQFRNYATQWLQFLGRWQAPIALVRPGADRVAAFADYMRDEQTLSPSTIRSRCWFVQEVLGRLCASCQLEEVTPAQVDAVFLPMLEQGSYARTTLRGYADHLRAFFRYAEAQGWCRHGLADATQGPRLYTLSTLPLGPSWEDVQRLLASAAGDDAKAIRDRAILLLLAVYGCRASEAAHLRLEDLDWERELIHLTRAKSARTQTYPLSRTVGDAILRYLREVRPRSLCREVFLALNGPFRPLVPASLWNIVAPRLRALGVSLRHYGPHALRHACATHLLEQGFTLKQIGDHLGHREPKSTRTYAKVDLAGLRQVADFGIGELL